MKVANIVSQTKVSVSDDFNVVKSLDEIIQGLPTLVVGWDFVNKHFPDADVINRKISDNMFWTFKRTEKRSIHEEDIYYFTHNVYKKLINELTYIFIDPILFSRKKMLKVLRKINTSHLITYIHGDMVYIYCDKVIFGIDLNLIEFVGLKRDNVLKKISLRSQVVLVQNVIFIEYKDRVENLDNQVKFIPYLYSIEHG